MDRQPLGTPLLKRGNIRDPRIENKRSGIIGVLKAMTQATAKHLLQQQGGKVSTMVSRKTDIRICAERTEEGKVVEENIQYQKFKQLSAGNRIWNEDRLKKRWMENIGKSSGRM